MREDLSERIRRIVELSERIKEAEDELTGLLGMKSPAGGQKRAPKARRTVKAVSRPKRVQDGLEGRRMTPKRREIAERRERVKKMMRQGKTALQISEELEVNINKIKTDIREMGGAQTIRGASGYDDGNDRSLREDGAGGDADVVGWECSQCCETVNQKEKPKYCLECESTEFKEVYG